MLTSAADIAMNTRFPPILAALAFTAAVAFGLAAWAAGHAMALPLYAL